MCTATAAVAKSAVQGTLGANGAERSRSGIGVADVGPTRSGATQAEAALKGKRPDAATIKQAAELAAAAAQPSADLRGSAEYKKDLVRVLTARALRRESSAPKEGNERDALQLSVNGEKHEADVEPRLLLVHLIREVLRLTGTHIGCDTTHCGACTVLMDGRPVKSCTVFAVQANGEQLMTVEGLEQNGTLHPLQEASWTSTGCSAVSARRAC